MLRVPGVGLAVVHLQLRAGGSGDDGVGLGLRALGLALKLRYRRDVVPGLGVGPVWTGHTFLCHKNHLRDSLPGMWRE